MIFSFEKIDTISSTCTALASWTSSSAGAMTSACPYWFVCLGSIFSKPFTSCFVHLPATSGFFWLGVVLLDFSWHFSLVRCMRWVRVPSCWVQSFFFSCLFFHNRMDERHAGPMVQDDIMGQMLWTRARILQLQLGGLELRSYKVFAFPSSQVCVHPPVAAAVARCCSRCCSFVC